jgi:hypothetical protein
VIGKGDKECRVPLPEAMLAELRRLLPTHHNPRWVTPDRSGTGPVSKNALWRTFRLAVRGAGIVDEGLHQAEPGTSDGQKPLEPPTTFGEWQTAEIPAVTVQKKKA